MSTYDEVIGGATRASGGEDVAVTMTPSRFEAFYLEYCERHSFTPQEDCPFVSAGHPIESGGMCWITVRPEDWRERQERGRQRHVESQLAEARQQRMLQAGGI